MKISLVPITAAACLLYCAPFNNAQAQNAAAVLVDIAPCMNLAVSAERYECYDKLEAGVRAAQRSAPQLSTERADARPAAVAPAAGRPPAVVTPSVPAPNPATAVTAFGQESPAVAEAARVVANQQGEEELRDRITGLQEREPGRWLITLESGQVWYQSNSQRNRLRKGMDVRIYPSPLGGSYRMSQVNGADTGFIQVARIQ